MLKTRIITAAILLPIFLLAILLLPTAAFAVVAGIVMGLAAWEWADLVHPGSRTLRITSTLLFVLVACLLYWQVFGAMVLCLAAPLWLLITAWVIMFQFDFSLFLHWQWLRFILAPIVLGLAFESLLYLHGHPHGSFWIIYLLLLVVATDTGAYFTGSFIGNNKLITKVSPNKTWEGLFGGIGLALLVSIVVYFLKIVPDASFGFYVLFSVVISLASVVGDLFESVLKRMVGLKDSGSLIPGHGGVLDRLDSILAALPVGCILIMWLL